MSDADTAEKLAREIIAGWEADPFGLESALVAAFRAYEHDCIAYRAALGYAAPGDHDGRLRDGTIPNNGIAEAQAQQIAQLEAEGAMLRHELAKHTPPHALDPVTITSPPAVRKERLKR